MPRGVGPWPSDLFPGGWLGHLCGMGAPSSALPQLGFPALRELSMLSRGLAFGLLIPRQVAWPPERDGVTNAWVPPRWCPDWPRDLTRSREPVPFGTELSHGTPWTSRPSLGLRLGIDPKGLPYQWRLVWRRPLGQPQPPRLSRNLPLMGGIPGWVVVLRDTKC